jgi:hypothetical protein
VYVPISEVRSVLIVKEGVAELKVKILVLIAVPPILLTQV